MKRMRKKACTAALALCVGCVGDLGEEPSGPPPSSVPETGVAEAGLRRLTAYEYDLTIADLLLDDTRPGLALLPEDLRAPYDNDYRDQRASQVLIEAAEHLA